MKAKLFWIPALTFVMLLALQNITFALEETIDDFFEEIKKVEARQSRFLDEKAQIDFSLSELEEKRKEAFGRYANASGSGDELEIHDAKADYILIRSNMINEEYALVKKALTVYFENVNALKDLVKKLKEQKGQERDFDPKIRAKNQADLTKLTFFVNNIKEISETLSNPGFILADDPGLKAKFDTASFSARSIMRFVNFDRKRMEQGTGQISKAALESMEKHSSMVVAGYLAYRDRLRELKDEKLRTNIAIRVSMSELGILALKAPNSIKSLKQDYNYKNKKIEEIKQEDQLVYY